MAVTEPTISGSNMAPASLSGGRKRVAACVFTFASDAEGTYTLPIILPKGARVWDVRFNLSATAGASAQLALGITGTTGKYRAAATLTTANAWVSSALNAAIGVELTAAETLILTTTVAALPASGRMVILVEYSVD